MGAMNVTFTYKTVDIKTPLDHCFQFGTIQHHHSTTRPYIGSNRHGHDMDMKQVKTWK